MAPEVLNGSYTNQADLWSLGVIAYMLLSSTMPFCGHNRSQITKSIVSGSFQMKGRRWKKISRQAKSFVSDLLVVDPADRATAEDALGTQWINRYYNMTLRNLTTIPVASHHATNELDNVKDTMMRFVDYNKLRKVTLMIVAHKSTSDEIGILRKVFQKYDAKRTGQVKYDQFKKAISEAGFSEDDIRKVFEAVVSPVLINF
jgi:calcium-dependent protein kinase